MSEPAPESRPAFPPAAVRRTALLSAAAGAWALGWMALECWFQRRGYGAVAQAFAPLAATLVLAAGWAFRPPAAAWLPAARRALAGVLLVALAAGWSVVRLRGGGVEPGGWLDGPLSILATSRGADLLRSLWLEGLLLPLAGLVLAEAWRDRAAGRAGRGPLVAAGGLALVAVAALVNQAAGWRATAVLRPGAPAGAFEGLRPRGEVRTLPGFRVRLDPFEAEDPTPGFRLVRLPDPPGPDWVARVEPGQGGVLPGGLRYQVERLIPDALPSGRVEEDPAGPENPALQVMLGLGRAEPLVGVLFARQADGWRRDEPAGRFSVGYRERFDPRLLQDLRPHPPLRQRLVLAFLGRSLEHPVRLGDTWELPGFSLTVAGIFPDFGGVRTGPDGARAFFSRSPVYRNPWIQVRLRQSGGAQADLLLSAFPVQDPAYQDYLARTLPPGMTLRYEPEGAELQTRFVLFTRTDGKLRLVEDGRVARTADATLNHPFLVEKGLSVTPLARFDHARFEPDFVPNPDVETEPAARRPVLRLRVWDPATGASEERWLQVRGEDGQPVGAAFLGGRIRLAYRPKGPDPRALRATLAVVDPAGTELARGGIGVDTPLAWHGIEVYVDGWVPGPPAALRILAVQDPGKRVAMLGLALVVAGWFWALLEARRASA